MERAIGIYGMQRGWYTATALRKALPGEDTNTFRSTTIGMREALDDLEQQLTYAAIKKTFILVGGAAEKNPYIWTYVYNTAARDQDPPDIIFLSQKYTKNELCKMAIKTEYERVNPKSDLLIGVSIAQLKPKQPPFVPPKYLDMPSQSKRFY